MLISNTSPLDYELEQSEAPGVRAGGTLFSLILILAMLAANAGAPGVTSTPELTNATGFASSTTNIAESIVPATPASGYSPFSFGN